MCKLQTQLQVCPLCSAAPVPCCRRTSCLPHTLPCPPPPHSYEAKAAEDKARYQREMAAFKAGQAGEAAAAADEPDAGEADGNASD